MEKLGEKDSGLIVAVPGLAAGHAGSERPVGLGERARLRPGRWASAVRQPLSGPALDSLHHVRPWTRTRRAWGLGERSVIGKLKSRSDGGGPRCHDGRYGTPGPGPGGPRSDREHDASGRGGGVSLWHGHGLQAPRSRSPTRRFQYPSPTSI